MPKPDSYGLGHKWKVKKEKIQKDGVLRDSPMKKQTGAYYFQTPSQLSVSGSPWACIAAGLEKLSPENAIPPPHALSSNH